MVYGLWLSAAGMAGNMYRQDIASNNLANVDTVGFKHDLALISERPVESLEDADAAAHSHRLFDHLTGGIITAPTMHSFAQGPANVTNGPLDVMIDGDAFFEIQTPDGLRYTRDGRFTLNNQSQLVTVAGGNPVLSDAGAEIIMTGNETPAIDINGRIMQGETPVATLGLVEFDDPNMLRKVGANLFLATANAQTRPASSKVHPGTLEGSTIDPVVGLVGMIEATRSFQLNANMLRLQETMLGRAVNDIARF